MRKIFIYLLALCLLVTLAVAQRRGGGGGHQKRNAEGIDPVAA